MSESKDIERYLAVIFADAPAHSLIELRWRIPVGMAHEFVGADRTSAVAEAILRRARNTDVYVGVLPRRRRGGGRADLVETGSVLWADCDSAAAVSALSQFAPQPGVLIASGSDERRHAYWLLAEPVSLDDIEDANHALVSRLGADHACAGAATILRPLSWNHKHDPPRPVQLLDCDPDRRTTIADVLGACGEVQRSRNPRPPRASARAHDDPLLDVPPAVYVEAITGLRPGRSRKVSCPFHEDHTPSLHVYDEPERGWFCYSCRRGGSAYDLGAAWFRIAPRGDGFRELQQRLDALLHPLVDLSLGDH